MNATKTTWTECPATAVPKHGRFDTLRRDQGQIVTYSYWTDSRYEAGDDSKFRRVVDASIPRGKPGHTTYYRRGR